MRSRIAKVERRLAALPTPPDRTAYLEQQALDQLTLEVMAAASDALGDLLQDRVPSAEGIAALREVDAVRARLGLPTVLKAEP